MVASLDVLHAVIKIKERAKKGVIVRKDSKINTKISKLYVTYY